MNLNRRRHWLIGVSVITAVIVIYSLGLLLPLPHAQEIRKTNTCAGAEVQSIEVDSEDPLLSATPPKIEIAPQETSETTPSTAGKAVTVIVLGPVRDSLDFPGITTSLACTAKGFVLTATITTAAEYHNILQNLLWRPRIKMAFVLRQPEVVFEVIWKMRLPTGVELHHVSAAPYGDQKYPITMTATVR